MRAPDRTDSGRRSGGCAYPRGGTATCGGGFQLVRNSHSVRARACGSRRIPAHASGARAAGTSASGAITVTSRWPVTRREVVGALAVGATLGAPAILCAASTDRPAIHLRRGMNLWPWFSLTREFPPPSTQYDWPPYQPDRAIPTRDDLSALRRAGIDFVRLPVDPGPLLAFSGERRRRLFADVVAAIDLALAQDLSVVVNLHPNNATHHWNSAQLVGAVNAPLFTRYLGLVRDMAAALNRFDPARVA